MKLQMRRSDGELCDFYLLVVSWLPLWPNQPTLIEDTISSGDLRLLLSFGMAEAALVACRVVPLYIVARRQGRDLEYHCASYCYGRPSLSSNFGTLTRVLVGYFGLRVAQVLTCWMSMLQA